VILFIALRTRDAYSSLYPPDKKVTPAKAGGAVLLRAKTVLKAASYAVDDSLSLLLAPHRTILGFNRQPSKKTLF